MKAFKTVLSSNTAEITEKRSRFIAVISHIESAAQGAEVLAKIKSEHWAAKHNVYAYSLSENNERRYSDDGEPHGTAGKPILDVIVGRGLENVIIVVTRYFGGVLLGTGGLVRAYSSAAALAVDTAEICEIKTCIKGTVKCNYSQFEILKKLLERYNCIIDNIDYADNISVEFCVDKELFEDMENDIIDTFFNQIIPENTQEILFPLKS